MTLVIELEQCFERSLRSIEELTAVGVACRTSGACGRLKRVSRWM